MDERITVVTGDITRQDVDAIVNAANAYLAHGGGVAAAIAMAGAPDVTEESLSWIAEHGPVQSGEAAVTSAGGMPADSVIHVVGPVYQEGRDNEALLRRAVHAALDAAVATGAKSVALPAISSGIYGYPAEDACRVIVEAANEWLASGGSLEEIRLVAFVESTADLFRSALR